MILCLPLLMIEEGTSLITDLPDGASEILRFSELSRKVGETLRW